MSNVQIDKLSADSCWRSGKQKADGDLGPCIVCDGGDWQKAMNDHQDDYCKGLPGDKVVVQRVGCGFNWWRAKCGPRPVDCKGAWVDGTKWTPMSCTEEQGTQTYKVKTSAKYGGKGCDHGDGDKQTQTRNRTFHPNTQYCVNGKTILPKKKNLETCSSPDMCQSGACANVRTGNNTLVKKCCPLNTRHNVSDSCANTQSVGGWCWHDENCKGEGATYTCFDGKCGLRVNCTETYKDEIKTYSPTAVDCRNNKYRERTWTFSTKSGLGSHGGTDCAHRSQPTQILDAAVDATGAHKICATNKLCQKDTDCASGYCRAGSYVPFINGKCAVVCNEKTQYQTDANTCSPKRPKGAPCKFSGMCQNDMLCSTECFECNAGCNRFFAQLGDDVIHGGEDVANFVKKNWDTIKSVTDMIPIVGCAIRTISLIDDAFEHKSGVSDGIACALDCTGDLLGPALEGAEIAVKGASVLFKAGEKGGSTVFVKGTESELKAMANGGADVFRNKTAEKVAQQTSDVAQTAKDVDKATERAAQAAKGAKKTKDAEAAAAKEAAVAQKRAAQARKEEAKKTKQAEAAAAKVAAERKAKEAAEAEVATRAAAKREAEATAKREAEAEAVAKAAAKREASAVAKKAAEAEAATRAAAKREAEAEAKREAKAEAEARAEAAAKAKAEAAAEAGVEEEAKAAAAAKAKAKAAAEAETEKEAKAKAATVAKREAEAEQKVAEEDKTKAVKDHEATVESYAVSKAEAKKLIAEARATNAGKRVEKARTDVKETQETAKKAEARTKETGNAATKTKVRAKDAATKAKTAEIRAANTESEMTKAESKVAKANKDGASREQVEKAEKERDAVKVKHDSAKADHGRLERDSKDAKGEHEKSEKEHEDAKKEETKTKKDRDEAKKEEKKATDEEARAKEEVKKANDTFRKTRMIAKTGLDAGKMLVPPSSSPTPLPSTPLPSTPSSSSMSSTASQRDTLGWRIGALVLLLAIALVVGGGGLLVSTRKRITTRSP